MPPVAICREVPPTIGDCELTHLGREPIDVAAARREHTAYILALEELGCRVELLPADPDHPDSVFVEDTAVVLDGVAVLTRPGAESRRGEVDAIERALAPLVECVRIAAPATLDGGDVVRLGERLFVGMSSRSSEAGARALRALVRPFGYTVDAVPVRGCLHLKSAATAIADDAVLANPEWVDPAAFGAREVVLVDPGEPFAANVVRVGDTLVHDERYGLTRARLERAGQRVRPVPAAELAKAEGAVTCCSLVLPDRRTRP